MILSLGEGRNASFSGGSREVRGGSALASWEGTRDLWDGQSQGSWLKLQKLLGVRMVACTAHGRGGGAGTSPWGSPPSTGIDEQHPGQGAGRCHAGPCPLSLCLPVDYEVYQIHHLSFCDKGICTIFLKEREIPDVWTSTDNFR